MPSREWRWLSCPCPLSPADGRPSKSLTLDQALTVITAAETLPVMELRPGLKDVRRPAALMHAYIVLSLLCGLRTEEARALRWAHVDLDGDPAARPPVPPHIAIWRSVRAHGETKTERSRRTLGLPQAAVLAFRTWSGLQAGERLAAGDGWQDTGLVFTSHLGAALDAGNVRKMFKRICTEAGVGDGWTPRELRTSFVSLMSHRGVSIEEIARLVGHASTRTTEVVYRRELRPVITRRRDHGRTLRKNLAPRAGPGAAQDPHKPARIFGYLTRTTISARSRWPSADLARHHALLPLVGRHQFRSCRIYAEDAVSAAARTALRCSRSVPRRQSCQASLNQGGYAGSRLRPELGHVSALQLFTGT